MAGLDSTQCCHPSSCCFLVGPVVSPLRIHSQFGSQEKTRREFTSRFEGFPPCRIHLFWDLPPLFSVALAALVSVLKHHKLKGGPSAGVLVTLCRVHWAVSSGKRPQNCGHQPTEFPFQSLTASGGSGRPSFRQLFWMCTAEVIHTTIACGRRSRYKAFHLTDTETVCPFVWRKKVAA